MEAVKERPHPRENRINSKGHKATTQSSNEIQDQSTQGNPAPITQKIQVESPIEKNNTIGNLDASSDTTSLFPPSLLSSEVQAGMASHSPSSNINSSPAMLPEIQSRINHFLIYPFCVNINTGNWEKMRLFYEEVIELNLISLPDQDNLLFLGASVAINLKKISDFGTSSEKHNIEFIFYTDLTLARLSRKISTRGVKINNGSFGSQQAPIIWIEDPDGNKISFLSTKSNEKE